MLDVRFYIQKGASDVEYLDKRATQYSMDILNDTYHVQLEDKAGKVHEVYVSAYTNEFQKVFEISDEPSKNIFETEKDKPKEESKIEQAPEEESKTQITISQVSLSLINKKTEVLTVVLQNLVTILRQKQSEMIYFVNLDRLQIDN